MIVPWGVGAPFQGWDLFRDVIPGRCPGLMLGHPFGVKKSSRIVPAAKVNVSVNLERVMHLKKHYFPAPTGRFKSAWGTAPGKGPKRFLQPCKGDLIPLEWQTKSA